VFWVLGQLGNCFVHGQADEWESKPVPEWTRTGATACTVKLEPQWFKTKFWNNKQEKKNPWFAFRVKADGTQHVSIPFPVYQYYPDKTNPNTPEYHKTAVAPLVDEGLPLMCDSLARALGSGLIMPSSAEKKTSKRKTDTSSKKRAGSGPVAAARAADLSRARSASPKGGRFASVAASGGSIGGAGGLGQQAPLSPALRPRTGSGNFKPGRHRRSFGKKAAAARGMPGFPMIGALMGPPDQGVEDIRRRMNTGLSHNSY
jgi:hypothetical protein